LLNLCALLFELVGLIRHPAINRTMPDNRGATVLDDLPESVIVCEILARLPPKDALRCRAVHKSWRRATSTRDFLLAHHHHQPFLPVIKQYAGIKHGPVVAALHGAGAVNRKLWPVLRYATPPKGGARLQLQLQLHDCRDGLLIVSDTVGVSSPKRIFYVCNPTTRQCNPLPQLVEHDQQIFTTSIAGLYLHHPSGEYRLLYSRLSGPQNINVNFYVTTIGSDKPRRFIGWPPPSSPPSVEQVWRIATSFSRTTTPRSGSRMNRALPHRAPRSETGRDVHVVSSSRALGNALARRSSE
jgi:hypothetical protein